MIIEIKLQHQHTFDSSKLESPRQTCNTSHGTIRRTFEHAFDMELPPIGNHGCEGDQSEDAFCDERKVKSLKQVEVVAWIILITISIECFIGESGPSLEL